MAGAELMICVLSFGMQNPNPDDAFATLRNLEDFAVGKVDTGSWKITHVLNGEEYLGPMDESAKLTINNLNTTTHITCRTDAARINYLYRDQGNCNNTNSHRHQPQQPDHQPHTADRTKWPTRVCVWEGNRH